MMEAVPADERKRDYALRSPLPPEVVAARTGLTVEQVRAIRAGER